MATYLQGVQDTVEAVVPPQPNLQFEAQMLQTRQSKYDAAHSQLSKMYGTILSSSLTRQDNIQARDEFFKLVDNDIKRIAGMDLSKESNVSQAEGVFKQIYDNDYLVKDMVWTKNYQNQMQRADQFKNCIDPDKCGGEYWDEGVKYLQYKRQEFAETNADDALGFQDVEYVPYQNLMAKAMKSAKDSGLSITVDQLTGDYITTTKNGAKLVTPLTELFSKLYGENPGFQKQHEVQSYIERKDWASQKVNEGVYKSMNEAEVGYIKERAQAMNDAVAKVSADIGADNEILDRQLQHLTDKINNGEVTQGSADHIRYQQLLELKSMSDQAKQFTEISELAMKKANNHSVVRQIGSQLDQASAINRLNSEISEVANTLAYRDSEVKMEADEFAVMRVEHGYDVALENLKSRNKIAEEQWKLEHGHSSYSEGTGGGPMSVGHSIEKDFKKAFGSSSEAKMADIKKRAEEKYRTISQTELDKLSTKEGSPGWEERKKLEKQKNENELKRKQFILEEQAKAMDQLNSEAGSESSYHSDLINRGADAPVQVYSGESETGGGGGTYSPSGGGTAYYPNVGGGTVRSSQGGGQGTTPVRKSPSPKSERLDDDAPHRFSDYSYDSESLTDNELKAIAKSHPNPEKRAYYQSIVKRGGAEYVKKMPEKEKANIYKNVGRRLDEVGMQEDGWTATHDTKIKVGQASAEAKFSKNNKEVREKKLEASTRISTEYMKTLKGKELESVQNWTERYLIKNGTIDQFGMLRYNGKEIGYVYRNVDGTEQRYAHGGSGPIKLQDKINKDKDKKGANQWAGQFHLHPNNRKDILTKGNLIKMASSSKYFSESIYNGRIKGKVDESQGDFFQKEIFTTLSKQHSYYDGVHKSYQQSKKDMSSDIMSKVNGTIAKTGVFTGSSIDADEFIKDGYFSPSERIKNSPQLKAEAYKIYKDAMDQVYVERNVKDYYMPGTGSQIAKTMKAWNVDLNVDSPNDVSNDVRNYLLEVRKGSTRNNTAALSIQKKGQSSVMLDDIETITNDFLSGKKEISSISYNAVGGTNPRDKNQGNTNWSQMIITDDKGVKYSFLVDNEKHPTGIYNKSLSTEKTQVLNMTGQYVAVDADPKITQGKPIKIVKKNANSIGISGKVWAWDQTAGVPKYDNVEDVLQEAGISVDGLTPEEIEPVLNKLFEISKKEYETYNPKVRL